MERVAEAAQALDFIQARSQGLDPLVGYRGAMLSGANAWPYRLFTIEQVDRIVVR